MSSNSKATVVRYLNFINYNYINKIALLRIRDDRNGFIKSFNYFKKIKRFEEKKNYEKNNKYIYAIITRHSQ